MGSTIACRVCGHHNQEGFKFCSECGKSRNPPPQAREFPVVLSIHPEADLTAVMKEVLGYYAHLTDDWLPSTGYFEALCHSELSKNQRQCLYRRYQLHLPGTHDKVVSYAAIAAEREGPESTVVTAVAAAIRNLGFFRELTKNKVAEMTDR